MTTSTSENTPINPTPSFLSHHGQKLTALVFWLLLLGAYWWYVESNDLTLADSAENLAILLTTSAIGPILYIIIYWLRPLIFFPATILTVLGGFLFGPIGILYTIIGANGSAMVASIALILVSIAASRYLKKREAAKSSGQEAGAWEAPLRRGLLRRGLLCRGLLCRGLLRRGLLRRGLLRRGLLRRGLLCKGLLCKGLLCKGLLCKGLLCKGLLCKGLLST